MKGIILFTLIALTACGPSLEERRALECKKSNTPTTYHGNYKVVIIDSCEYIIYDDGFYKERVYGMVHKGNCKFCLNRK